jgi:hypothetical protein
MPDLWLEWHDDFSPDATGDLQTVDGDDETRQRLERRLFTATHGYVWHQEYGAGLPQRIGDPYTINAIKAIVVPQIYLEAAVAPSPPVQIFIGSSPSDPNYVGIGIKYWDAATGIAVSFTIDALTT